MGIVPCLRVVCVCVIVCARMFACMCKFCVSLRVIYLLVRSSCVCLYVHMCLCVCLLVDMFVCMCFVCEFACNMSACASLYVRVRICICVCEFVCDISACMSVHVCLHKCM